MSTGWTHPQCEACWINEHAILGISGASLDVVAIKRLPHRIKREDGFIGDLQQCCFCGNLTISGIYVRSDPRAVGHCGGHDD